MAKSNLLSTRTVNFGELVGNGKRYRVPPFQRDYSWQEEQWEDLWKDLLELRERPDASHYMGAIVVDARDDREHLVIDGQQRIATLSILAIAVLDRLRTLESAGVEAEANRERAEVLRARFVGEKDPTSLVYASKLSLNAVDDEFYQDFLVNTRAPQNLRALPQSQRLLWESFTYFQRHLAAEPALGESGAALATLLNDCVARQLLFIQITVDDEINAYTVFETLNARGLELSSTDLLKNYLFSRVRTQHDLAGLGRAWQRVIDPVGQRNFPEFLRYHLMASLPQVRQQRLFKIVRERVSDGPGAFALLHRLEMVAQIYAALREPEHEYWIDRPECRPHVRALKLFRVHQPFPVLMTAYQHLERGEFQRLLKLVVAISYRYTVICGLNTNDLEPAYHEAAKGIEDGRLRTAGQVFQAMRAIYVDDQKFVQDFALKRFESTGAQRKLAKYTLCGIESECAKRDCDFETDTGTLEHILPENPGEGWHETFAEERREQYVARIGNLTLLEPGLNRRVGNADFASKRAVYAESGYQITRAITDERWLPAHLERRQREMAKAAARIWRSDFEL